MIKKKRAFTLIEVLLYLGLFGIVFLLILQFSIQINEFNNNSFAEIDVEREVAFTMLHIEQTFKSVTSISSTNSVFANTNGVLQMTLNDGSTVKYSVTSGRINFNQITNYYLTSSRAVVDSFYVEKIISTKTNGIIGARITITMHNVKNSALFRTVTTSFLI